MWARALSTAIGIWLMAAPGVLAFGGPLADVHRIAGPLAASFALVAMAQATRSVRWCNGLLGVAIGVSALAVRTPHAAAANLALSGVALVALATVRGRLTERLGGGWRVLWRQRSGGPHPRA